MRPVRLAENRLAVPGVIGVRSPGGLSFGHQVHVLTGPDAGFPEYQPLDEWKSEVALVDVRALPPELRKEAGLELPDVEIAELEASRREMMELELTFDYEDRKLAELALQQRARLTPLEEQARRVLEAHGYEYWLAGFTRHSDSLWVHRMGGPTPIKAWTNRWYETRVDTADDVPPSWLRLEQYYELRRVRWADRVLRALSGGAVTETGLLFARQRGDGSELLEDDLARQGVEVAARMAAGADEVLIPLHGPARRVRLPAFTMTVSEVHPLDKPASQHEARVPAEDTWVLTRDLR
ncbi:hypothetical protein [Pyxidicoccus sp. MSG2]|uniref:hypothetical protein n=1 Tax=Pyxidicoccus sp. MSG2 TaxID=2996790 RepID=UPI00226F1069|nr:hypothetical protein [Pyxidicoccus sp. MSG2]MCY1018610.1 hypothetical protein [Pyxidicoccus sp. MSG2]